MARAISPTALVMTAAVTSTAFAACVLPQAHADSDDAAFLRTIHRIW